MHVHVCAHILVCICVCMFAYMSMCVDDVKRQGQRSSPRACMEFFLSLMGLVLTKETKASSGPGNPHLFFTHGWDSKPSQPCPTFIDGF